MNQAKHICPLCDYIYDDEKGDVSLGFEPGSPFCQLPEDFKHPGCSGTKDMFETCTCVQVESSRQLIERDLSRKALAALVSDCPNYGPVLDRFNLDYCCNGNVSLSDACRMQDIETTAVIEELIKESISFCRSRRSEETVGDVIKEIVSEHHSYLSREIPTISQMLQKLVSNHCDEYPELKEISETFQQLKDELDHHVEKEKTILFPLCIEFDEAPVSLKALRDPLAVLQHEHSKIHGTLRKIQLLTGRYKGSSRRCDLYSQLVDRMTRFESEMHIHIHKENNILFPMVTEKALLAELRSF